MGMRMYTVGAIITVNDGRVVMNQKQAFRRRHHVKRIEGDVYEILKPVQFKIGEQIGLDDTAVKKVHLASLSAVGGGTEDDEQNSSPQGNSQPNQDPEGSDSQISEPDASDLPVEGNEELENLHWKKLKEMVESNGGTWVNKIEGIAFLKSQNNGG